MTTRSFTRTVGLLGALGLLGLGAVACGDDSTTSSNPSTSSPASVTVTHQWARTSPASVSNGAVYFTITSPIDDRIVGASVDASVATRTELHETVMQTRTTAMGNPPMTDGQMTMQPVDGIDLKAGVPFVFQPGGYHVMLFNLVKPLQKGDTFVLTLTLQKAGSIKVDVPVLDEAP